MDRRTFLHRASALGLTVATSNLRHSLAAPVRLAEITGHVLAGTKPLAGVRVSDGFDVVSTDGAGQFRMSVGSESGPFLFVTTPRGYWTDRFYVPTEMAVAKPPVFRLRKTEEQDDYRALYLADVHLGQGQDRQSFKRLQATIDEINEMEPLPALCWMGGDISLQNKTGRQYVELTSRLKCPVRNAVGNHEMLVEQSDARGEFHQLFGPTYYSFDWGRMHYVTLDGCRINRGSDGYKSVEGLVSRRELHWLAEDLRRVPEGKTTLVAIHIPLHTDYPERRDTTAAKTPHWVIQNADEVVDLLSKHGVGLVLQGHLHENNRLLHKGIEFVESISVCGTWWKSPEGQREIGVSGEPRGYRILDVDGTKITHRYRSSAESRVGAIGEIVGCPKRLPEAKAATLQVNVFDGTNQAEVIARIDDRPVQPLRPSGDSVYFANLKPAHHWEWTIPGETLSKGRHRLTVQAKEPGQVAETFQHYVIV